MCRNVFSSHCSFFFLSLRQIKIFLAGPVIPRWNDWFWTGCGSGWMLENMDYGDAASLLWTPQLLINGAWSAAAPVSICQSHSRSGGLFLALSYITVNREGGENAGRERASDAKRGILDTGFVFLAGFVISKNRTAKGTWEWEHGRAREVSSLSFLVLSKCQGEMPFSVFFEVLCFFLCPGNWCFPTRGQKIASAM